MDEYGYLMGSVPASPGREDEPTIGLIAHVDTSPDMTGAGVNPQVIELYDGGDIQLNEQVTMRVRDFPELASVRGHSLITTDGTTLLGADNKAGVAEIMTLAEWMMRGGAGPEGHPKIRIAFTPDEEVGRGMDHFDVARFGAQYAYTVDGGAEGEFEYENFNAAGAKITIHGRNIHPGYAKDKMINALQLACTLHAQLPATQCPEQTEGYDGFFHLVGMEGSVEQAQLEYIIRDHDSVHFEERKALLRQIVASFNNTDHPVSLTLADQYYNMREQIMPHPHVIEQALDAIRRTGLTPIVRPIRGGTDGARLSYMGVPCPNLFTGAMNFHGRYEYCSLDSMVRSVETLRHIVTAPKQK